ncbi:AAA family ATPase [Aurantiacibacter sp. MUD61]|uniref:AAA family ATPase n=1 Tax=Aurantiacibacter sp. MUD61 TaxID=3009083 RepID=UPI0022F0E165|nr:AAA family ATPase [Aurantiacibacter sp. MUD61]
MNAQQSIKQFDQELAKPTGARFDDGETLPIFDMARLNGPPPPPRDWVLEGLIPEGEITLFTGPGGAGKSLFAQQLATCVAARKPMLGAATGRLQDIGNFVLYVTCEDDDDELHRRQRKINQAIGAPDLSENLLLSSIRGQQANELATFNHDGTLEIADTFKLLSRTIGRAGVQFVILDNVAHLFAGNENDRGQVTRFVNLLYKLVQTYRVTILLIGHPNKSGDNYSGSTAWLNAVRSQIHIDRVQDEHGNCLDPDARTLALAKANYSRLGKSVEFRWHDFAFVRDEDLPPDAARELAEAAKANGENAAYLRCLAAATERKRAVSENTGTNYFAAVFCKMPEGKGYGKEAFKRAHERLLAIGAIELDAKLWQRENRAWKYGIRAVESPAEKCTDHPHQPPALTATDQGEKAARTDHLYTTYITGAAPDEPPAPETGICPACGDAGCDRCKQ